MIWKSKISKVQVLNIRIFFFFFFGDGNQALPFLLKTVCLFYVMVLPFSGNKANMDLL